MSTSFRTPTSRPASFSRRQVLSGLGGGAALLATGGLSRVAQAAPGDPVSAFPADLALDWYTLILSLTKSTSGFSPPVASRALAYVGIAVYEAVHTGMPGARSLAGLLPGLTVSPPPPNGAHWGAVANATFWEIIHRLYATTSTANVEAAKKLRHAYEVAYSASAGVGAVKKANSHAAAIANYIFDWSRYDGGHQGYLSNFPASYQPPVGAGLWTPTPPGFQPALQPYWGNNRAFTLPSNSAFDPGPHDPAHSATIGSPFYVLAQQVRDAVNSPASPEWTTIARFWSDDPGATSTPPGHSISIASQVIAQEGVALDFAVEVYLKLGLAVADAFISCWNTKYRHNVVRPVSYIRNHIQPEWSPLLGTPPFPEYTSGHSVQSGAMAEVLEDLFGDDLAFVDHTHDDRGFAPRAFASFEAAAQEAAISRLYGGIHYLPAIALGVTQGRQVGARVNALAIR